MEYERYTKKELAEIIREMKEKLKEVKGAEKTLTASAEEMSQLGLGVQKNAKGKYELIELKYDVEKNAAVINRVIALDTHDFAIANFKALQHLTEKIMRKAKGDKYAE